MIFRINLLKIPRRGKKFDRLKKGDIPWAPEPAKAFPAIGKIPPKRPMLRPWFYNERADQQPVNGEYDFNSGNGDYFFGKPYFVHQHAREYFYEQIGFIENEERLVNLVILDPGVVEADISGKETHNRGDSVWVNRETALRLIMDGAAWVNYDGEWIDHVKNRGIFEPEKIDGRRKPKQEHILFDKELKIVYRTGWPHKSWIVTKESIRSQIRKSVKIDINEKLFSVAEQSKIQLGDVNPSGKLKIEVDLGLIADGLNKQIYDVTVERKPSVTQNV